MWVNLKGLIWNYFSVSASCIAEEQRKKYAKVNPSKISLTEIILFRKIQKVWLLRKAWHNQIVYQFQTTRIWSKSTNGFIPHFFPTAEFFQTVICFVISLKNLRACSTEGRGNSFDHRFLLTQSNITHYIADTTILWHLLCYAG